MKVATNLIVAAVLVALTTTSANAKTETTSVVASEPSEFDTEELSLTPSSSESTTKESDKDSSKSLAKTEDPTDEPSQDLYDLSSPSCSSDDEDIPPESTTEPNAETGMEGFTGQQSEDDSSIPKTESNGKSELSETEGLTGQQSEDDSSIPKTESNGKSEFSETEGFTGEQSDDDSSTPLYDFSSPSCSSDAGEPGSFSNEEKAIWIERHNFFRVAALPWAAGNMKRINWDDELAKEAASAAESCSAETTAGLNVFKASSSDPSAVIDEALNEWAVKPALSNIGSVVPPAKEGDPVGAGLYNSYTQVIWSSTTGVGCAMADCSGASMVVCKYSPVGNDGKSPWFIHAAQATQCPTGTTASLGLCVVEGDPANKLIAPIPKGKTSLEVYSTFIADIMAAILKAAKARDAPGAHPVSVVSPNESVSDSSVSDTEALPTDEESEAAGEGKDVMGEGKDVMGEGLDSSTAMDSLPEEGKSFGFSKDLGEGKDVTGEDPSTSESAPATDSLPEEGESFGMSKELGEGKDVTSEDLLNSESSTAMDPLPEEGKSFGLSKEQGESSELSPTSSFEQLGKVKPKSEDGGDKEAPPESAELGGLGDLTGQESNKLTPSATSGLKATAMANTQSAMVAKDSGMSPAAIAGIIVAGVVAVAIVAVFISYRKNQQRQRDIMHDGGVEII